MASYSKQDFVTNLYAMGSNNQKINDAFKTFIHELTSLRDVLEQPDIDLGDFRDAVSELLPWLQLLHPMYKDLVREARKVAGDMQSRLQDFTCVILPVLSAQSGDVMMKAELESWLEGMAREEAETCRIYEEFSTLCQYVQQAVLRCKALERFLSKDLKRKHRKILKEYTDKLKKYGMDLAKSLLGLFAGGAEDVVSSVIMAVAPSLIKATFHTGRYAHGYLRIRKEGTKFGRVRQPEWQDECSQFGENATMNLDAWCGIVDEMRSLQISLSQKAAQDDAAPLLFNDDEWQGKASTYADMSLNLRRYQIAVI